MARLLATEADLILSIRYGGILRADAIAAARHGVINLHSGLLPDYRGVMATFHAMRRGESTIGTTLHYIADANIDTGDVIDNTSLALEPGRSYLWHVLQLYPQACERLLGCVRAVAGGEFPAAKPQPRGGAYYGFPDEAQLAEFHRAGHMLYHSSDRQLLNHLTQD